jgi:cation transport ATPase
MGTRAPGLWHRDLGAVIVPNLPHLDSASKSFGHAHEASEDLIFAFAYKVIGIPIAAGVLYPTFGPLLRPVTSALAMSFSSVPVAASALRLRSSRL